MHAIACLALSATWGEQAGNQHPQNRRPPGARRVGGWNHEKFVNPDREGVLIIAPRHRIVSLGVARDIAKKVSIPIMIDDGRTVRANLTFDAGLLRDIDAAANQRG